SQSQARECPPHARIEQVIENGVSLERFHPEKKKGKYALAMGRICPEKGIHLALDAASAAGLPLFLAGTAFGYRSHQSYFEDAIRGSEKLDPAACRREAELRFSSEVMQAKYMNLYRKAAANSAHRPVHSEDLQLCEATC